MSVINILLKLKNVAGAIINPRKEDGHGSATGTPTHVLVGRLNGSSPNPGNSKLYTSVDGTTEFVGAAYDTRNPLELTQRLVAAQQIVFASNVASGLGATFIFQYGPDGLTWPISETRVITDFATVRDLTLQNAGNFFRMRFTPSRALTGAEFINLDTTQWYVAPPAFVRLANQQIEEANAAMGHQFSYLKLFDSITGKSVNVRPTENGDLRVGFNSIVSPGNSSLVPILAGQTFTGTWDKVEDFSQINFITRADQAGTFYFDFSVDGVTIDRTATFAYPLAGQAVNTDYHRIVSPRGSYFRVRFTNTAGLNQTIFRQEVSYKYTAAQIVTSPLGETPTDTTQATLGKSVILGKNPDGVYGFVPTSGELTAAATSTPLLANGVYTSAAVDMAQFSHIVLCLISDVASAANGIELQFSLNPAASFVQHGAGIFDAYGSPNTIYRRLVPDQAKSFRVKYTNGAAAQGTFIFRMFPQIESASISQTILNSQINDTSLAAMIRGVLAVRKPDGTFINVPGDTAGRILTNVGSEFGRLLQSSVENDERLKLDVAPTTVIAGSITDGATTLSTTVTSPGGQFKPWMRGAKITGTGIPARTYLNEITSAGSAVMSNAATAANSGLTLSTSQGALLLGKCPLAAYDGEALHNVTLVTLDRYRKPTSITFRQLLQWNQRLQGWT